MRSKGKLVTWHSAKAFGFIAPMHNKSVDKKAGSTQLFIHKSAFLNKTRTPKIDDIITFTISKDKQGRPCAKDATFGGEKFSKKAGHRSERLPTYLASVFILGLLLAYLQFLLPTWIFILYAGSSVISVVMYIVDKSRAKLGGQRIPEIALHIIAILGGWPGAAISQQILKHKNRKKPFKVGFWLSVLFNLACLVWFVT